MKKILFFGLGIIVIAVVIYFIRPSRMQKTELDVLDKSNPKVCVLFDSLAKQEIERYKGSISYPGCLPTANERIEALFKSIKFAEMYAEFGSGNSYRFNYLCVKITFNDGRIVDDVYTGKRILSSLISSQFLFKLEFNNGNSVQCWTNGAERNRGPGNCMPDLRTLFEALVKYDMEGNRASYFFPDKTNQDINKEWEKIK
jgi:hypothetical protein